MPTAASTAVKASFGTIGLLFLALSASTVCAACNGSHAAYGVAGNTAAVITLAGQTAAGDVDSTLPLTARFSNPSGLVLHAVTGAIYISDTTNNKIKMLSATGQVSTIAGSGAAGDNDNAAPLLATFSAPQGLAVNYATNVVYIADTSSCKVRQVALSASNAVTTVAGRAGCGSLDSPSLLGSKFNYPEALAYNHGVETSRRIYVADTQGNSIRQLDLDSGAVTTLVSGLSLPRGITFDPITKNLYYTTASSVIRRTSAGTITTLVGTLTDIRGVVGDWTNGRLYFADTSQRKLYFVATSGGVATVVAGSGSSGTSDSANPSSATFNSPGPVAFDTVAGGLVVLDRGGNKVRAVRNVAVGCAPVHTASDSPSNSGTASSSLSHSGYPTSSVIMSASLSGPSTTQSPSGSEAATLTSALSPTPTIKRGSSTTASLSASGISASTTRLRMRETTTSRTAAAPRRSFTTTLYPHLARTTTTTPNPSDHPTASRVARSSHTRALRMSRTLPLNMTRTATLRMEVGATRTSRLGTSTHTADHTVLPPRLSRTTTTTPRTIHSATSSSPPRAPISRTASMIVTLATTIVTVAPSPATTVAPSPATTVAPSPATTVAPSPATTVAPSPATTVAPSPATTVAPTPATTVAPSPATTVAPTPATTVAPTPATTVAPSPATTIAPSPATTVAPTPATTVAPTPATTVAPSPATTVAPSTTPPDPSSPSASPETTNETSTNASSAPPATTPQRPHTTTVTMKCSGTQWDHVLAQQYAVVAAAVQTDLAVCFLTPVDHVKVISLAVGSLIVVAEVQHSRTESPYTIFSSLELDRVNAAYEPYRDASDGSIRLMEASVVDSNDAAPSSGDQHGPFPCNSTCISLFVTGAVLLVVVLTVAVVFAARRRLDLPVKELDPIKVCSPSHGDSDTSWNGGAGNGAEKDRSSDDATARKVRFDVDNPNVVWGRSVDREWPDDNFFFPDRGAKKRPPVFVQPNRDKEKVGQYDHVDFLQPCERGTPIFTHVEQCPSTVVTPDDVDPYPNPLQVPIPFTSQSPGPVYQRAQEHDALHDMR
jgi:hypothetical protein